MRLNKEHFWRDRLYNYAIKSAAATFKRSTSFIRERYIVPVSSNFPVPIGHNANFAWNQDEVPQNSREAKKFFNIS